MVNVLQLQESDRGCDEPQDRGKQPKKGDDDFKEINEKHLGSIVYSKCRPDGPK